MNTNKKHRLSAKVWIEVENKPVLGKGGADILTQIQRDKSISKAAKNLSMSYRYVWGYLQKIEQALDMPVVETFKGGKSGGGGAHLTKLGESLLSEYRRAEACLADALSSVGSSVAAKRTKKR